MLWSLMRDCSCDEGLCGPAWLDLTLAFSLCLGVSVSAVRHVGTGSYRAIAFTTSTEPSSANMTGPAALTLVAITTIALATHTSVTITTIAPAMVSSVTITTMIAPATVSSVTTITKIAPAMVSLVATCPSFRAAPRWQIRRWERWVCKGLVEVSGSLKGNYRSHLCCHHWFKFINQGVVMMVWFRKLAFCFIYKQKVFFFKYQNLPCMVFSCRQQTHQSDLECSYSLIC